MATDLKLVPVITFDKDVTKCRRHNEYAAVDKGIEAQRGPGARVDYYGYPYTSNWDLANARNSPYAFSKHPVLDKDQRDIFIGFEWECGSANPDKDPFKSNYSSDEKGIKHGKELPLLYTENQALFFHMEFGHGGSPYEHRSIPATVNYHRAWINQLLFTEDGKSLGYNFKKAQGCGIHIHVDRKCFTPASMRKFATFIVMPHNSAFITAIAERAPNMWCKRSQFDVTPIAKGDKSGRVSDSTVRVGADNRIVFSGDNKGYAITTEQPHTVEVRIFDSVSTKEKLITKLEFIDAAVRYTHGHTFYNLIWEDFVVWVNERAEKYPYLVSDDKFMEFTAKVKNHKVVKIDEVELEMAPAKA